MILLNQTIPNNPKPSQTKPNQTKPPQTAPDFLHFLSLVAQSWHSYRVGSDLQIQTPVSAFLFVWNVIWVRVKIWHIYVLQWEGPVLAFLFVCNIEGIVICVYKDMATTEKWGLPDQKKRCLNKNKRSVWPTDALCASWTPGCFEPGFENRLSIEMKKIVFYFPSWIHHYE